MASVVVMTSSEKIRPRSPSGTTACNAYDDIAQLPPPPVCATVTRTTTSQNHGATETPRYITPNVAIETAIPGSSPPPDAPTTAIVPQAELATAFAPARSTGSTRLGSAADAAGV